MTHKLTTTVSYTPTGRALVLTKCGHWVKLGTISGGKCVGHWDNNTPSCPKCAVEVLTATK